MPDDNHKKVYVLDTNVLLDNPRFIENHQVLILPIVLRELENLEKKFARKELKYKIRVAKRVINNNLDNVTFSPELSNEKEATENYTGFDNTYGDNIIIAYIKAFEEELIQEVDNNVTYVMYTEDILLKFKCEQNQIPVVSYVGSEHEVELTGMRTFWYDKMNEDHNQFLADLYQDGQSETTNSLSILQNEYLVVQDEVTEEIIETFFYNGHVFKKAPYQKIKNNNDIVAPRNTEQKLAIDLLLRDSIKVKSITGPGGSGKDMLIFNSALKKLHEGEINNIIWIGNPVLSNGTEDIGFLPGTTEDKLYDNYAVLGDILGSKYSLQEMIDKGELIIEYVGGLRSRTFNNAYVIVGEYQNFTLAQLKLILGRVGENSFIAFNGDTNQVDINNSGLETFISELYGNELFGHVELNEVERSEVSKLATLL